jgi:hypothetical protein
MRHRTFGGKPAARLRLWAGEDAVREASDIGHRNKAPNGKREASAVLAEHARGFGTLFSALENQPALRATLRARRSGTR